LGYWELVGTIVGMQALVAFVVLGLLRLWYPP
jgi:hypothetical protein